MGPRLRRGECRAGQRPGQRRRPGRCAPVAAGGCGADVFFTARGRGPGGAAGRDAQGLRPQLGADAQPPGGGCGLQRRCGAGRGAVQVHPGAAAGGPNHAQPAGARAGRAAGAGACRLCAGAHRCAARTGRCAPGPAVRPAAAATGHCCCRTPRGGGQRSDWRGARGVFPHAHAVGSGRIPGGAAGGSVQRAQPVLVAGACARGVDF